MHARIDILDTAFVAPITTYEPPRVDGPGLPAIKGKFDGGVYLANGKLLPFGANAYLTHDNIAKPAIQPKMAQRFIHGRYLYLGMMQNHHFGHFISESIARVWGIDHVNNVDGFVHIRRFPGQQMQPHVMEVLNTLLPNLPHEHVDCLTRVEQLIVPQAMRFPPGYIRGTTAMRAFFQKKVAALLAEKPWTGPRNVYVSRAALPSNTPVARLLLEEEIASNLEAEGYETIYPEKLSFKDQLRLYASADNLVFAEGSAFHVYVLAAREGQNVFNIWRRKVMHPVFRQQLASFQNIELSGQSHVSDMYTRKDAPNVLAQAMAVIDFEALRADLMDTGFIKGNRWTNPSDRQIRKAIKAVSSTYDVTRSI